MPDAPKPPPPGPKPRQPSRPEILVKVDKTVGAGKSYAASQDHVRPELIRKGTLIGIGSKLAPPPLPLEHAKTVRAPSTSAPTVRATPALGIRATVDETPTTGRPGASLPPPSTDPAELARQARVAAESKAPGPYQTPLVATTAPGPAPSDSIRPDGSLASLRKAQTRVYVGLGSLLAVIAVPLGAWLNVAAEAKTKSETATVKADNATSTAERADAKASTNTKTQTNLEQQFRQHRANEREVWRMLGVDVPKHDGDPEPENLEPMIPYCAPGKVCPGPQLVLRRSP